MNDSKRIRIFSKDEKKHFRLLAAEKATTEHDVFRRLSRDCLEVVQKLLSNKHCPAHILEFIFDDWCQSPTKFKHVRNLVLAHPNCTKYIRDQEKLFFVQDLMDI